MTATIPSVLQAVVDEPNTDRKARILRGNNSQALRVILALTHNKNFKPILSKKVVNQVASEKQNPPPADYKNHGKGEQTYEAASHLFREYRILPQMFEGKNQLSEQQCADKVRQLHDVLPADEFDIVLKVLKQDKLAKTVTDNLVRKAFPDLPMHEPSGARKNSTSSSASSSSSDKKQDSE